MVAVEYIIERELLASRSVALPFVGTLSVSYIGAHVEPEMAIAPYGVLTLEEEFREEYSLILLLADQFCNGHYDSGVDLYNIWLASCSDGHSLDIEGVCHISLDDFTISPYTVFDDLLHPAGYEAISLAADPSVQNASTHEQFTPHTLPYDDPIVEHQQIKVKKNSGVVGLVLAIVFIVAAVTYVASYLYFRH